MFFPTLIGLPILAGLVAGVWTARRAVPWGLAALCVALGAAGAVVMAFDPDHRLENVTFASAQGSSARDWSGWATAWGGSAAGRCALRSSPACRREGRSGGPLVLARAMSDPRGGEVEPE
jgi:hypothetical protein